MSFFVIETAGGAAAWVMNRGVCCQHTATVQVCDAWMVCLPVRAHQQSCEDQGPAACPLPPSRQLWSIWVLLPLALRQPSSLSPVGFTNVF